MHRRSRSKRNLMSEEQELQSQVESSNLMPQPKKRKTFKQKKYKCNVCNLVLVFKIRELDNHLRSHNCIEPSKCGRCRKGFIYEQNMRKHMTKCTVEKQANKDDDNLNHLGSSNGLTIERIRNAFFSEYDSDIDNPDDSPPNIRDSLAAYTKNDELKEPHSEEKRKISEQPESNSPEQDEAVSLMHKTKAEYRLKNKFVCNLCKFICSQQVLDKHLLEFHKIKKSLVCEICGMPSHDYWHKQRHMNTHGKEKKFKCDIVGCQLGFCSLSSLKRHQEAKHRDQQPCPVPQQSIKPKTVTKVKKASRRKTTKREFCGSTQDDKHLNHLYGNNRTCELISSDEKGVPSVPDKRLENSNTSTPNFHNSSSINEGEIFLHGDNGPMEPLSEGNYIFLDSNNQFTNLGIVNENYNFNDLRDSNNLDVEHMGSTENAVYYEHNNDFDSNDPALIINDSSADRPRQITIYFNPDDGTFRTESEIPFHEL